MKQGIRTASNLRKNMPHAERLLWTVLRNRQFHGVKFRRQYPMDGYVADFICLDRKLIIELDGPFHEDNEAYDKNRDRILENNGFKVLRFKNDHFIDNFDFVLEKIEHALSPNKAPLLLGEGLG